MDSQAPRVEDALVLLRQALAAADEALSAIASLDQLQERFEDVVVPNIAEPDVWSATCSGSEEAKKQLYSVRACIEEMQTQVTRIQSPEAQTKAWADQFVELNGKLQAALAGANQQVTRVYEVMRPVLISRYLENATRSPRWTETWPFDADEAARSLERVAGGEFGTVEQLDLQLARFRWEVGWPQQRMAAVVGLSQPAVAARLARMETLINLSVASARVRADAQSDGFAVTRSSIVAGKIGQGPIGDLSLEGENCFVEVNLLIAAGDTGIGRKPISPDRSFLLDYLRPMPNRRQAELIPCILRSVAVYFRDRGVVNYYSTEQVAETVRQLRSAPAETVLQHLRDTVAPARGIGELVQRMTNAG